MYCVILGKCKYSYIKTSPAPRIIIYTCYLLPSGYVFALAKGRRHADVPAEKVLG